MDEQAILVHNTHRVLYGNEALSRLFRCAGANLVGKNITELIATDEFRHLAKIHMRVLRERGEAPTIEYPFMRCDASIFWANTTSACLDEQRFTWTLTITFEEWWLW